MSAMASQITVRLTICSTACHDWKQKKYPNTLIADEIICKTEIAFCNIVITVTPHERHGVPNHSPLDNSLWDYYRLRFVQQHAMAESKINI